MILAFPKPKDLQEFPADTIEKMVIREKVFDRDRRRCVDCHKPVIFPRGYWNSMHLMHLKSKGSGGDWSMENLATGCLECHAKNHNSGGKPVKITKAEARK
jgi:5-methylcytosine-specific restriction endonuclease McrA